MFRIGSLFSGIGGLDLGLERAGVGSPAWFCDVEPFALSALGNAVVPQCAEVVGRRLLEIAGACGSLVMEV